MVLNEKRSSGGYNIKIDLKVVGLEGCGQAISGLE
jgi:hypothetical protein